MPLTSEKNLLNLLLMIFLAVLYAPAATAGKAPSPPGVTFNGDRAFQDLKHLVSFGPRPAGSEALAKSRDWIIEQLKGSGCEVEQDAFTASTPDGEIPMLNLIAKAPGSSPAVIMITGHYDTKKYDNFKFVGANDGASSAAFLLEAARQLCREKRPATTWLVFFDGEEAVRDWSATDSVYGSRHLEAELAASGELSRIKAMILVDMIADAHLDILQDTNSTPWLTDMVFRTADRLGYSRYFLNQKTAIWDDHNLFVSAGVSAVDIIDLDYGPNGSYWHTAKDTVEHCSPASLTIVGRVVMETLRELEQSPHVQ
ncbi:MAG: M28 family peptidase [Terriglobia bacterium]